MPSTPRPGLMCWTTLTRLNERGQSVIMVTHDMRSARRWNRILYLKDGVMLGECDLGRYVSGDGERHKKLVAMMLNLWLMLALDYKANFDRCHDKLNAEHVIMVVDGDTPELCDFFTGTLERDGRAARFRLDSCLYMVANFTYNGGELNSQMIFLDKDTALSRDIGGAEIVEDGGGSGIHLPMLYRTDEIDVKSFVLSIGSNPVTYTVWDGN